VAFVARCPTSVQPGLSPRLQNRIRFLFALVAAAQAQAPAQASTQATAPPGTESNSLLAAAAAGDAQSQFALGIYYFGAR
jgi:hypothetical protein